MMNHTNMQKGIIYCRVSSQGQTQGTSLESQRRACEQYAEAKGLKVAKVFVERGESATAADRTELIKALDYCKENKDEIVAFIVWKLDRFARNTQDHYGLQVQLLKYGTVLHSASEEIIKEGAPGRLMEAMLAGYAQFENDIRKQRCEGGMRARIRDGVRPWSPPLGYTNSKNRKDRRKLLADQPDEERFYLIQKGLRVYMMGEHTITALTGESNKWGLRTRTGKPMRKQLWEKILTDKFYAGVLVDPWSGAEHKCLHKPMLTLEEFEQIQRVKRGLSNHATNNRLHYHPDFPLRRTVRCTCGSYLTASWQKGRSKKYPYYRCHNRNCSTKSGVAKSELEDKFYSFLSSVQPDQRFLTLLEKIVLDELKNKKAVATHEKKNYETQIQHIEEQGGRLLDLRIAGEVSKEEFAKRKGELENRLIGLTIAQREAHTDELGIEAPLAYGLKFARNVARH